MKDYLCHPAATDLLESIRLQFLVGQASWTETLERIASLQNMCRPISLVGLEADRILGIERWSSPSRDWPEDENDAAATGGEREGDEPETETALIRSDDSDGSISSQPEQEFWYLIPGSATGMSDWSFHQYDVDFHPTIPHGHSLSEYGRKLDPYQGWVYEGSAQIGRASRRRIVALWNDDKFRDFALRAINFYLEEFPSYKGWRVRNPRRLPRRA